MNRRSFITKALAGLAAVPLIGKLIHAKEPLEPPANGFLFTPEHGLRCFNGGKEVFPDTDGYYVISFEPSQPVSFDRKLTSDESRQVYDHLNEKYGFKL